MTDDDEQMQLAFRMSLQDVSMANAESTSQHVAKRVKAGEELGPVSPAEPTPTTETPEARERRIQREVRAAAAERRLAALAGQQSGGAVPRGAPLQSSSAPPPAASSPAGGVSPSAKPPAAAVEGRLSGPPTAAEHSSAGHEQQTAAAVEATSVAEVTQQPGESAADLAADVDPDESRWQQLHGLQSLPLDAAFRLFDVVFGREAPPQTLTQWSHQGLHFSPHPSSRVGLVQREGGPCGVLAPLQALLLRRLLFPPQGAGGTQPQEAQTDLSTVTTGQCRKAVISAIAEALLSASSRSQRAVTIAVIHPSRLKGDQSPLSNPTTLHGAIRVCHVAQPSLSRVSVALAPLFPAFETGLGAALVLFSALLSRGLDEVQKDRDDPEPPLVTLPFGHASQEIVNLLLCGRCVANVFDGSMDMGGGMALQGIPGPVQVGFLTQLEALHYCQVGHHLKHPQAPIWVVGSESHYTVLFALAEDVQGESDAEEEERRVRDAFDRFDTSGGGGFVASSSLPALLSSLHVRMPPNTLASLSASEIVVWNELWQALQQLDRNLGGFKPVPGAEKPASKTFELYHFNGIAKPVVEPASGSNGPMSATSDQAAGGQPRLTRLVVTVPPRWTPDEVSGGQVAYSVPGEDGSEVIVVEDMCDSTEGQAGGLPASREAPLVEVIRTRWRRAVCWWEGPPPSIV